MSTKAQRREPVVDEVVKELDRWLRSRAGSSALDKTVELIGRSTAELEKLRQIDPETLDKPVTL